MKVAGIQSVLTKVNLYHATYISLTYKFEFFILNPELGSIRV